MIRNSATQAAVRVEERANAAAALAADPKFKKYTQQVEKCLATFDNVHEWADFIAFLTKLLKTLQSFMQYKEIPRKLIVGKRLAQCLNPALPTGVHQRALDVYSHILAVLGPEYLERDLQIWSPGLFPFFEFAATSVKPTLLNIYDTHYLPLQSALRPVMKAFILALLPGLEEETGEFFEKVLSILDKLSGAVSPAFFLQNIWLVLLTSVAGRPSALNYLSRRFPKLTGDDDITQIIGRDVGLMVRGLAAALEDDNILVRRGTLELLVQSFRLDSAAFSRTNDEDRVVLMRSAAGVVLRRDLSLNRRLFAWLLGPNEQSAAQINYFKTHGLDLLSRTLKDEMLSTSQAGQETRPYKIIVSLLDKWEIGSLLTEHLILDALRAVKQSLQGGAEADRDDLLMTINTLVESVEPAMLWKHLFVAVHHELTSETPDTSAIRMMHFVLTTFKIQDDEVLQTHLPIILTALADLLTILIINGLDKLEPSPAIGETIRLLREFIRLIPSGTLLRPIELLEDTTTAPLRRDEISGLDCRPYTRALRFYGLDHDVFRPQDPGAVLASHQPGPSSLSVFQNMASITQRCALALSNQSSVDCAIHAAQECLSGSLSVMLDLMSRLEDRVQSPLALSWDPSSWLEQVMLCMEESMPFDVVDKVIDVVVKLSQTKYLEPNPIIDNRPTMFKMTTILLCYLRPQYVLYHLRAVQLIWLLETSTRNRHVESIIAQTLAIQTSESQRSLEAFEAFGVLWRLTDDSLMPGFRFKAPLLIVLDTLKSDDTNTRRVGETWMRCSLKSYVRALDPILYELLDPSIMKVEITETYHGRDVRGFHYVRNFDLRRIHHLLDCLLSLVKFGGQGFCRVIRTTSLKKSYYPGLISLAESANVAHPKASYMDVLTELLVQLVQAEPKLSLRNTMAEPVVNIQATVIDILQAVVARGEVEALTLDNLEAAIISKLFSAVHTGHLDLQHKLLHALHSVILATAAGTEITDKKARGPKSSDPASTLVEELPLGEDKSSAGLNNNSPVNPLLVQTLMDGISLPSNRPMLQHWIDFILMTVPLFHQTLSLWVFPLSECICQQLQSALLEIVQACHGDKVGTSTTDAEFIMWLNALERLVVLSLTNVDVDQQDEEAPVDKAGGESGGLLGIVSNVFASETFSAVEASLAPKSAGYRSLHQSVQVLYSISVASAWKPVEGSLSTTESLLLIFSRIRVRSRKVLERLFRLQSTDVLESIIECFYTRDLGEGVGSSVRANSTFEILDILSASAQTLVHMLCECISHRVVLSTERSKKLPLNPNVSDAVLFDFLEEYLGRLEGPIVAQVWGRYISLIKELATNVHAYKSQVFPALRCLTVLSEKITQTAAVDERRIRRELQELFTKLVDTCVLIAGRSFEQGNWIRRSSAKESLVTERASPIPRVQSEINMNERLDSPSTSVDDATKSAWRLDLIDQITEFLALRVVPNLRRFLVDADKVAAICNNIAYYIINPAMKSKTRTVDVDGIILDILIELSKIPSASKSWRGPVSEAFNDNRFFNGFPESSKKWMPLVKNLMDSDKQGLIELIGKVSSAPSANIFANREYEMLLRSLNLRRLSFVLFSGERNHFLAQLPAIQEKLVDILRSGVLAPIVVSEVYLCLRVLLCRLSPNNLTSFWPVILTELYRVFEQVVTLPPSNGSEDLGLILAACKFLDLILVLQTEEFQVHQWMFVTDTVDAVYRPENWTPVSLMDQLAEVISESPRNTKAEANARASSLSASIFPGVTSSSVVSSRGQHLRRPLLGAIKTIDSIDSLLPFFSHISLSSFESVYGSVLAVGGSSNASAGNATAAVDWSVVESMLLEEMFEGT